MTLRCTLTMSLLVTSILGSSLYSQEVPVKAAMPQEVLWRRDYNDVRKEQEEKKLPIIIDFYTNQCFWCDRMDATTFREAQVIQMMNLRFLSLKIDGNKEKELAKTLGIQAYPTTIIAGADGKILETLVGYQPADQFLGVLQRVSSALIAPDWMEQDLTYARKWHGKGEYPLAISALKKITEDGKARPVQVEASRLLQEIDNMASTHLLKAHDMVNQGKKPEAIKILTDAITLFPGTQASKEGKEMLARIAQAPTEDEQQMARVRRARELLAQARDFYKKEDFILCLDRCAKLTDGYLELPEGTEAMQITQEIRNNPEWLQGAADAISDRLGRVYLDLADSLLKKGQPQRAEFYLTRVVQSFPGSRLAESAQIRLQQLQGSIAKNSEQGK